MAPISADTVDFSIIFFFFLNVKNFKKSGNQIFCPNDSPMIVFTSLLLEVLSLVERSTVCFTSWKWNVDLNMLSSNVDLKCWPQHVVLKCWPQHVVLIMLSSTCWNSFESLTWFRTALKILIYRKFTEYCYKFKQISERIANDSSNLNFWKAKTFCTQRLQHELNKNI